MRRAGLGAPNEARFGFVQAVATDDTGVGTLAFVSGQVGKDNTTGEMLPATSLTERAAHAIDNVDEASRLAHTSSRVVSCTAFVPDLPRRRAETATALRTLGDRPAVVTVVGIAALSSPDYWIELSAHAVVEESAVSEIRPHVIEWPDPAPVGAIGPAAVVVGDLVHLSGHLGWDVEGRLVLGGVADQLAACYDAVDRSLARAGLSRAALVAEHVFVVADDEPLDFAAVCDAHEAATRGRRPASTLVPVTSLAVEGARACVSAVAVRSDEHVARAEQRGGTSVP